MMMLLRRSNNDDCSLPVWATPTERQLSREVLVNERDLKRHLRHLEAHGWLEVPEGQHGRGRPPLNKQQPTASRRNAYVLMPRTPERCAAPCPGVRKRANKRGGTPPVREAEMVGQTPPEKVGTELSFPQVSEGGPPRDCAVTREVGEGETFATSNSEPGALEVAPEPPMFVARPVWLLPRPAPDESWKTWAPGTIGYEVNAMSDGSMS